ncbi:MAG: hypothetical protein M3R15_29045 [Acidobacteriota bacterium]|nr:hypothetical protein [Acidobacteriota bacterium]
MMIEELKEELETLSARRNELQSELLRGDVEVSSAREALLQGRVGAVQTVTIAHSSAEALRAAVMALDERIKHKRGSLADAELEAAQIEAFEQRLAIMRRGEVLLAEYITLRTEANDTLKLLAEKLIAAFFSLQDNRNQWLSSIDANDATFGFDDFIAAGADPTACRAQWDGTNRAASDKPYVLPSVVPFDTILWHIFVIHSEATKEASSRAA